MTRSTVQKAVVVLATKPVFGPIRDRLGVVTQTLFAQCDFSDLSILDAFHNSLEGSLRGQLTESGLYMGTNLCVWSLRLLSCRHFSLSVQERACPDFQTEDACACESSDIAKTGA